MGGHGWTEPAKDLSVVINVALCTGKSAPTAGGVTLASEWTEFPAGESVLTARYTRELSDSEMVSHSDVLTLEQLGVDEVVVQVCATDDEYRIGVRSQDHRHSRTVFEQIKAGLLLQEMDKR